MHHSVTFTCMPTVTKLKFTWWQGSDRRCPSLGVHGRDRHRHRTIGEVEYDVLYEHLSFDLERLTPYLETFAWHRIHELTDSVSLCRRSTCVSGGARQRGGVAHGHRAWSRPSTASVAQQTAQGEHEVRDTTGRRSRGYATRTCLCCELCARNARERRVR